MENTSKIHTDFPAKCIHVWELFYCSIKVEAFKLSGEIFILSFILVLPHDCVRIATGRRMATPRPAAAVAAAGVTLKVAAAAVVAAAEAVAAGAARWQPGSSRLD